MPKHFSLPRNGLVLELLGNGTFVDTNDGTKATVTPSNITYPACPVGYQKQCGSFNGSNSRVDFASPLGASATEFSVSIRVKTTAGSGDRYIFAGASNCVECVHLSSGNTIRFRVYNSGYLLTCDVTAPTGVWHDMTYVWSTAQGNAKAYVDGVLASTSADSRATSLNLTGSLSIGTYFGGSSGWYNGLVSAFRIYNRLLSETERAAFFMEFNRRLGGGSDMGIVIPAPSYYWDFKGDAIDIANAVAPDANSGTFAGADFFGNTKGITYNGSTKTDIPSVTGVSLFTWVFRFKTSQGTLGALFAPTGASLPTIYAYMGLITNNKFTFQMDYTGSNGYQLVTSVTSLNDNAWHTVIVTGDGTTNGLKMYVDGTLESTASAGKTATMNGGTYPSCGFGYRRYDNGSYLAASVSDIGLFPEAFTASQVTYMTNLLKQQYPYAFRRSILQAAGVHAYYDGTFSGSNAYDVAGGFGTKTISGTMPASVRAQQNKAYAPTGSQYINLSGANLYDASGWWIAQWIKTTASGDTRNECNSNTNGYWCHLAYNRGSAGKPESFFYDGSNKYAIGATSVNDGKWHLCIAEFVPGTHTRIWVDGRLEATTAVGTFASNVNTQQQYAFADRDAGSKVNGKADWIYGKGPMTSQKAQMLYFGTYRD